MRSLCVINLLLLLLLLLLLTACSRDVAVSAVLEDTGGLRPGDKVLLAEREVGTVEAIEVSSGSPGFIVDFGLFREHAELVQSNAVAYVPLTSPPTLALINPTAPADPVSAGARLKGLSPLEVTLWRAEDALQAASTLVERFSRQVEDYFSGEEWARTRSEIDADLAELAAESERAARTLSAELQELFESLQEEVEVGSQSLSDELAGIRREIEKLEAEGHEDLAEAVRRLLERVEGLAREGAPMEDPAQKPAPEDLIEAD